MMEKTQALALRVNPFSRTSHVVSWLTPTRGRVTTVVKGACRPKSAFLGQYDIFYTCELVYYSRDRNGVHILRECSPLNERRAFRSNWRAAAYASCVCDVASRISMTGGHEAQLYELAANALDFLASVDTRPQILFWFELQLLTILGLAPQLVKCTTCGRPRTDPGDITSFSINAGGILCRRCASGRQDPHTATDASILPLDPAMLSIMQKWQTSTSPRLPHNTKCAASQILAFRKIFGMFVEYHLGIGPVSRKIALDMVG